MTDTFDKREHRRCVPSFPLICILSVKPAISPQSRPHPHRVPFSMFFDRFFETTQKIHNFSARYDRMAKIIVLCAPRRGPFAVKHRVTDGGTCGLPIRAGPA